MLVIVCKLIIFESILSRSRLSIHFKAYLGDLSLGSRFAIHGGVPALFYYGICGSVTNITEYRTKFK